MRSTPCFILSLFAASFASSGIALGAEDCPPAELFAERTVERGIYSEQRLLSEQERELKDLKRQQEKALAALQARHEKEKGFLLEEGPRRARALLEEGLATQGALSIATQDALRLYWLESLKLERATALLLGNPYDALDEKRVQKFTKVAAEIAKTGWIIYDADALSAPIISEAAGDRAVGISGNPARCQDGKLRNCLPILNPFYRLRAFQTAGKILNTSDSITGNAIFVNGHNRIWLFDPTQESAGRWAAHLVGGRDVRPPKSGLNFNLRQALEVLKPEALTQAAEEALILARGQTAMSSLPGGAVVFGGAKSDPAKVQLIYELVRAIASHGIPVATGGSSGYMEVANAAAFDAGADSIGIPIAGIGLQGEQYVAASYQTLRLSSINYSTRIPLLLDRRQLVVVVPGEEGTKREVATTLFHIAANPDTPQQVLLLGPNAGKFWLPFVNSISQDPRWTSRFQNVSTPEAIHQVIHDQEKRLGQALVQELKTRLPPQPRNTGTQFVSRQRDDDK